MSSCCCVAVVVVVVVVVVAAVVVVVLVVVVVVVVGMKEGALSSAPRADSTTLYGPDIVNQRRQKDK